MGRRTHNVAQQSPHVAFAHFFDGDIGELIGGRTRNEDHPAIGKPSDRFPSRGERGQRDTRGKRCQRRHRI